MKIETTCPQFPGIYGTDFEPNFNSHFSSESDEFGVDVGYDYIDWDSKAYIKSVAEHYVGEIETELVKEGYISSMTFQEVWSPREYNFRNDIIKVVTEITEDNRQKIIEWVRANREVFDEEIKERFTAREASPSYYSNNGDEWFEMLVNDEFDDDDDVQYTFILEVIIKEDELKDDDSIRDNWQGNNSLTEFYTYKDDIPTEVKQAIESYYLNDDDL